jgi:hypothetical protein
MPGFKDPDWHHGDLDWVEVSSVKSVARSLLLRMMRKAGQCLGAMFVMDEPGYPGFSLAMRLA